MSEKAGREKKKKRSSEWMGRRAGSGSLSGPGSAHLGAPFTTDRFKQWIMFRQNFQQRVNSRACARSGSGHSEGVMWTNTKCCWRPGERSPSTPAAVFGPDKPQDEGSAVGEESANTEVKTLIWPPAGRQGRLNLPALTARQSEHEHSLLYSTVSNCLSSVINTKLWQYLTTFILKSVPLVI